MCVCVCNLCAVMYSMTLHNITEDSHAYYARMVNVRSRNVHTNDFLKIKTWEN